MSARIEFAHCRYLQVISADARAARKFAEYITGKPVTTRAVPLGQADPKRYKFGSRVYGFRMEPEARRRCGCKGCAAP